MRKRTNAEMAHLPQNVQKKGDAYYHVGTWPDGVRRWTPLGSSEHTALARAKRLLASSEYAAAKPRPKAPRSRWRDTKPWPAFLRSVLKNAEARAERIGKPCTISAVDLIEMFQQQMGRCAVSGISFSFTSATAHRVRPWVPSLDRLDNSKGYVKGNCRLVCAAVNVALNEWGEDILLKISSAVVFKNTVLK